MSNGGLIMQGSVDNAISSYFRLVSSSLSNKGLLSKSNNSKIELYEVSLLNYFESPNSAKFDSPLIFFIKGKALQAAKNVSFGISFTTYENVSIFTSRSIDSDATFDLNGQFELRIEVKHNVRAGSYILALGIDSYSENIYFNSSVSEIEILEVGDDEYKYKNYGLIDVQTAWEIKQ